MNVIAAVAVLLVSGVVLAHGVAWTVLGLTAIPRPAKPRPRRDGGDLVVIVPAHDEERLIGRCVTSLLSDGSVVRPEVLVVADNCSDGTAEAAEAAGARVLVRVDPVRRGKPFALDHALEHLRGRRRPPAAVAIVDADARVGPGFADALVTALDGGATVVQGHYRPEAGRGGLQRVRELAFALNHWARPLGARRLGLGTTLKGNGMAFRWDVVAGGGAWSGLAEDAGFTVDLARRGIAVAFVPGAVVSGYMASTYREARTQDLRWEAGRGTLRRRALVEAGRALVRGRFAAAAGCAEVASLPLTLLLLLATGSLAAAATAGVMVAWSFAAAASLATGLVAGWIAARVPPGALLGFVSVPRYLAHKLGVQAALALGRGPRDWQRTTRGD